MKRWITLFMIVAMVFTMAACGNEQGDPIEADPEEAITEEGPQGEAEYLLEEYENAVNSASMKGFLALLSDNYAEDVSRYNMEYSGPHRMGNVEIGEPVRMSNEFSLDSVWFLQGLIDSHEAVETYLAEVNYKLEGISEGDKDEGNYDYIGLPYTTEKDRYLVFVMVKDQGDWKIDSVIKPHNLTEIVQKGLLNFEETKEGNLSTLELQLMEEKFPSVVYYKTDDGIEMDVSEVNGFFRSYYDKPEYIDLKEFIRYFGIRSWDASDEELKELGELYERNTGNDLQTAVLDFAPVVKYRKSDVDDVLMKYAGVTSDDLRLNVSDDFYYLEDYDAFYNFTTDFGPGTFEPDEGHVDGDTYTFIEYKNQYDLEKVKVIFLRDGDDYRIQSREKM